MVQTNERKEHISWASIWELPRIRTFMSEQGACGGCIAFETERLILEDMGFKTKEELYHAYKEWADLNV